jgi:MFS transporter, BCD family, chlorophyll transporter
VVSSMAEQGHLGAALAVPATGYSIVYHIEIALLFATLAVIGPLVRTRHSPSKMQFGIAEFPG